jgi:hypothetical protein
VSLKDFKKFIVFEKFYILMVILVTYSSGRS